jgi:hypothetical protein
MLEATREREAILFLAEMAMGAYGEHLQWSAQSHVPLQSLLWGL